MPGSAISMMRDFNDGFRCAFAELVGNVFE